MATIDADRGEDGEGKTDVPRVGRLKKQEQDRGRPEEVEPGCGITEHPEKAVEQDDQEGARRRRRTAGHDPEEA